MFSKKVSDSEKKKIAVYVLKYKLAYTNASVSKEVLVFQKYYKTIPTSN